MGYKNNVEQIKNYVDYLAEEYEFSGLLHFTDFTNLNSIFKSGFLNSREFCESNNISFTDVADEEIIQKTNIDVKSCVRFYYKHKTPTLYRNEGIKANGEKPHVPIPVYLLFDNELMYLDNTAYSDGNAKSRYTSFGDNYEFLTLMDWECIFHRGPIYEEDEFEKREIVRKRHAELLSMEPVPLTHLNKVIFRCEADRKRAINLFGNNDIYFVDESMFHNTHNYIKDYKIMFRENVNEFVFEIYFYKSNWDSDYNFQYEILDKDNNILDVVGKVEKYNLSNIPIIEQFKFKKKVKFVFEGYSNEWHKINIFMNNILCIEEFCSDIQMIYDIIDEHSFKVSDNKVLKFRYKFTSDDFRNYSHKYKIFDKNDNNLSSGIINFPESQNGLAWITSISNYNEQWYRFQYFINDILCIDEIIKK